MNVPLIRRWLLRVFIVLVSLLGLIAAGGWYLVRWQPHIFQDPTYQSDQLLPFFKATEWTLFSLSPGQVYPEESPAPSDNATAGPELFYDHPVLGKTTTSVTPDLRAIVTDLDKSGKLWSGGVVSCFSPRHGIPAKVDSTVHDLLICYECASAQIYKDSVLMGTIYLSSDQYDQVQHEKQNKHFNAILTAAGIPTDLPPQERHRGDASKQ
ncbi:hypothetical protein [Verrucomicrobium sp. BvORR106]|uniref:hypothetical protein n=1 Tax=Verrucomicrobium sp. BvORR106 TaxID=1403819 RepID=UPI00056E0D28|nr:hypothetical protein [Verrucomicrobium sp. BvORR106]